MNDQILQVDINTAAMEDLAQLPGVGATIAERIIAARPYHSLDELRQVSGIGPQSLERLRPYVQIAQLETGAEAPVLTPPAAEMEPADITMPAAETRSAAETRPEAETLPEEETIAGAMGESEPAGEPASEEPLPPEKAPDVAAQPEKTPAAETGVEPAQPARAAPRQRVVSRSEVVWLALGSSLLALLLAVVISLGFLALINGGLRYANPAQLTLIRRQVDSIGSQADILQQDLDGLRERVNNLDGLSGRVGAIETESQAMRDDLDITAQRLESLNQQVAELNTSLEEMEQRTGRFESFLSNMRELLNQFFQPEESGK